MDVLKKVPVREQDAKVRAANFEEVCLGYNREEAMEEASRCINCKNAQCIKGCPVSINIPGFIEKVKEGDFVVGGENFGCGSSREQAPSVLKALGVRAVIAKSFARIFYRNSINIGLPVIVCKELPDEVKTGDTMELSMSDGTAQANGKTYSCTKLPEYMQNILNQGGLIASLNREEE